MSKLIHRSVLLAVAVMFVAATHVSYAADEKNITYIIDGESFQLVNGSVSKPYADLPGTESRKKVSLWPKNTVESDFNKDGKVDKLVVLSFEGGGSGTFSYMAVALKTDDGYIASNTVLLGDRVVINEIKVEPSGQIQAYYKDKWQETFQCNQLVFTAETGVLNQPKLCDNKAVKE
jgi:hypothetical protein